MRRRVAWGAAAAAASAVLASMLATGPVAAAGTLTVEPPSGVPGQTLTAKGSHSFGVQAVTLRWDGTQLPESGSSGNDGSFEIAFKIPAGAAVGGHDLRACVRGDCSIAPPFTVGVTVAPSVGPSPSANPSTAPSPSASASSSSAPSPAQSPEASGSPATSASAGASEAPSPTASAPGVIVLPSPGSTVLPTALPAEPDKYGKVKVQFGWLLVGGAGLGLLALLVLVARNNLSLRSRTEAPAKTPKLYEAMTKGTHAPARSASDHIQHEATDDADASPRRDASSPSVSEFNIAKSVDTAASGTSNPEVTNPEIANPEIGNANLPEPEVSAPEVPEEPRVKGDKIKEN